MDHSFFAHQLFYQLAIRKFSVMEPIELKASINICEYVRAALDTKEAMWMDDGDEEGFHK